VTVAYCLVFERCLLIFWASRRKASSSRNSAKRLWV